MSGSITSRSFRVANDSAMRTLSLYTILAEVMAVGTPVFCYPAKYLDFLVKFSILKSKMIFPGSFWYLGGRLSFSYKTLNALRTTLMYLMIEYFHSTSQIFLSVSRASLVVLGILIPNFCFLFMYLVLTLAIIISLFLRKYGAYQKNAGTVFILYDIDYLAVSMG